MANGLVLELVARSPCDCPPTNLGNMLPVRKVEVKSR